MKSSRRRFLHWAASAAALPALSCATRANTYPSHPVRLIVGFAPGSTTDILGRLIGQWLSERLGQQFVIENRPGAGGNVGAEAMVRSPPDGYTLYMVPPAVAANPALYTNLSFDFLKDAAPVAGVVRVPNVVEVNPSVPVKTLPELIDYAKTNPGKLSFASAGIGTASHLAGQLFNAMTGIHLQHVPYRGDGPAMVDLIGGQVQVGFATMTASIAYIRADKLRPLAVTTLKRSDALPNVPTVSEFGRDLRPAPGSASPRPRTRRPILLIKLNRETNAGLAGATIAARLADMGGMPLTGSPADFGKLIADETAKWGKVIREAGISAE